MIRFVSSILILIGLTWCFDMRAQTACPAGVAPGSPQCGPDSGTSRGDLAPPPPRPTGEWLKTWGALASNNSGDMGFAVGKLSKSDAQNEAAERCKAFGAGACEVFKVFYNQCVATAVSSSGRAGIATGGTKERASMLAVQECGGDSGRSCEITLAECSMPVFKKY